MNQYISNQSGSSECQISIDLLPRQHKIRVGIWFTKDKDKKLFDKVYEYKDEIETKINKENKANTELIRERLDDKKVSGVCTYIDGLDFDNQVNYPELMNQSIEMVLLFKKIFKPYTLE